MKKVKIIFWLLVAGLAILIMYQNRGFVVNEHTFGINLGLYSYQTPPVPNVALLLGFFVAGLLVAVFLMLPGRFRARKNVKSLNQEIKRHQEKNQVLEQQLQAARAETTPPVEAPAVPADAAEAD